MRYYYLHCGHDDKALFFTNNDKFERDPEMKNVKYFESKSEVREVEEEFPAAEDMKGWHKFDGQLIMCSDVHSCRGCQTIGHEVEERHDAHGITTGQWCDACYNSSKYPYKKEKYYDYLDAGEYLDDDY